MPCPGGLAQQMPALPASMPCTPQTVLPLQQPHSAGLATPYQQVVQPPKKPAGGESLLTPPLIKPPQWVMYQTTEDPAQEGREAAADPSVAKEVHRGRLVCSHCIRRVICPSSRCPVSYHHHHHQHLKEPSLGGEVSQGPPSMILCGWWQTFIAVDGGRTWSISSRSTTNTASTPLQSRNGRGSRSSSLTTSSNIRWKRWPLRKPGQWTLWPTSRTSSIRPPASTWMAL